MTICLHVGTRILIGISNSDFSCSNGVVILVTYSYPSRGIIKSFLPVLHIKSAATLFYIFSFVMLLCLCLNQRLSYRGALRLFPAIHQWTSLST